MDIKKDTFQITQLEPFTKYFWRVRSIDKESSNSLWSQVWNFYTSNIVSINELPLPNKFELKQNHPNPFNPTTKIKYSIPKEEKRQMSNLKLVVFDILGREVKTLVNENKKPGNYEIVFDASNLSSGVYFYSLQSDEFIETKMMLLIK
ncbi:MAG: T9SS type A sorting domain-containing protein [Ignavibacteriae bacterium]|nr:T9SS type A sorting domain-containing protein [Ignavibacteriota bacterium]